MKIPISAALVALFLVSAAPARAELVFFASGRTISVKGHRIEGQSLVLELRGGGEIVFDPSVISGIAPDEVPYPEPEPAVPPSQMVATGSEIDHSQPNLERLRPLINKAAEAQGVDAKLVHAVIRVESNYQERARSPKGAMGLMQLMPDTARQYAVADPYDPASNIDAGIKHLKSLLQHFQLPLALAAYNAGEAAVQRFGGIPPYAETRAYVARILNIVGK